MPRLSSYGKELDTMQVTRINPTQSSIVSHYDLPVLLKYMYMLGLDDRDLMFLVFVCGKKQEDIGTMFGVTQRAISHQMKKMRRRVRFIRRMRSVQKVISPFFHFVQTQYDVPVGQIDAALVMFYTTSQTASSHILGIGQAVVRYRFFSFIDRLKEMELPSEFEKVRKFFVYLRKKKSVMHRVMKA